MPLIHLTSPWTLQPQTNNPIAADVAVSGAQPIECVSRRIFTKTGTVSQKPTNRGMAWNFSSSSYLTLKDGATLGGKTNLTIFALFRTTSTSSDGAAIYCERGSSGNAILKMSVGRTSYATQRGVGLAYRNDSGTLLEVYQQVSNPIDGMWHTGAIVKRGQSWSVYQDGALAKTGTFSSASDAFTTTNIKTTVGSDFADIAGSSFVGDTPIVLGFGVALSASEIGELHANPWRLFWPEDLFVWIPDSAGGDASASLAGSGVTASVGSASPSLSTALSGTAVTSGVGTLSPSIGATATLSGTSSAAAVGSLSQSVTVAATGVQVSTASGVSTVGMSKDLTGNPSTASVGTLSPSVGATATLSGTATTTTTGSLAATLSITLGGVSTTASVGTLTLPGSYSAALNANQATASIGSIAPSVSNAIGGVQSATAVGASSSAGVSRSVTGNSSSANAGALAATLSVTVAGTSTSTAVGALSVPGSYSAELGSSAVSSLVGSLTTSVSVGVSGTLATTSVGTLTRTTAVIGSQTNTAVGALTVSVTNAVTGRSVIASSGSPLVAGGSFSASLYGNILATSSGLLTVLGAIPGPGESVNLYSRLATTKTLSSRIPQ